MAVLMDIILSLVKVLCGGSTTREQPPVEYQKSYPEPPHQQAIVTCPEKPRVPEHYRQVSVVPYMTPLEGQLFLECVINEMIPLTHSYTGARIEASTSVSSRTQTTSGTSPLDLSSLPGA